MTKITIFLTSLQLCFGGFGASNNVVVDAVKRIPAENFSIIPLEERLIKNRLNERNLRILSNLNNLREPTSRSRFRQTVDMRKSWRSFSIDHVQLMDAILDMVARFVSTINKKWRKLFSNSTQVKRLKGFTVEPLSQRRETQTLFVTFPRLSFIKSNLSPDKAAVDFILSRASASQVEEKCGAYDTFVTRIRSELLTKDFVHQRRQEIENNMACRTSTQSLPAVCCLPVEHQGIDYFFMDENNARNDDILANEIVTQCGCV